MIPFKELRGDRNIYQFELSGKNLKAIEENKVIPYMRTIEKYLRELGFKLLVSGEKYYEGMILDLVKRSPISEKTLIDKANISNRYFESMKRQNSSPRLDKFVNIIDVLGYEIEIKEI